LASGWTLYPGDGADGGDACLVGIIYGPTDEGRDTATLNIHEAFEFDDRNVGVAGTGVVPG
jgi:hypothetical protein